MANTFEVLSRTMDTHKFDADELNVIDGIVTLYHGGDVVAAFPKEAVFGAWKAAQK